VLNAPMRNHRGYILSAFGSAPNELASADAIP